LTKLDLGENGHITSQINPPLELTFPLPCYLVLIHENMTEIQKAPVLADENFSDSQEQGMVKVLDEDNAQLAELGHKAQLHRQYGLWSVVALGVLATNTWSALGGTFIAGVYAGGSTTIIYGFIFVTVANVFSRSAKHGE
jgi:hypothetical protein